MVVAVKIDIKQQKIKKKQKKLVAVSYNFSKWYFLLKTETQYKIDI